MIFYSNIGPKNGHFGAIIKAIKVVDKMHVFEV